MIGVKKISHASYETPDLERQIDYYTNILGLSLIARERDAVYLASTIEHHSVIPATRIASPLHADRLPARGGR